VILATHLARLPTDLANAVESEYRNLLDHHLKHEWDDAQVDAGRFCEAVLRVIEWHMTGWYTPIDGKSHPSRKVVVSKAAQDVSLPPTLRLQIPQAVELIMDFRNGRNAAHLGSIDPNRLDATCVVQLATWVVAEVVRLETQRSPGEVQTVIDELAKPHVPLVQIVGEQPIVLDPNMNAGDRTLVVLYQRGAPVSVEELRRWVEYGNSTRWRENVLVKLRTQRFIHIDAEDLVHLLAPGHAEAQRLIAERRAA
jgi:hypothetical protein